VNPKFLFIGIVSLYGLLSLIAAIGGMAEDGVRAPLILFMLASVVLVLSPWVPGTLVVLLVALTGLHIAAIWQGLDQGGLQWSHHVVRLVVSLAIVIVYLRLEE